MDKKEIINFCLSFENVYEDYPFSDKNWTVIRHCENKKVFAWIFKKDGYVWVNVKCRLEWIDFWRQTFDSVIPAYHLNKKYWNSIILDETVPREDIYRMIRESYELTSGLKNKSNKK